MPDKIRVLLADDDPIYVQGLCAALRDADGIEVVGKATTPSACLACVQELGADIVLLDLRWGDNEMGGIGVLSRLRHEFPRVFVIAISAYDHLVPKARLYGADWAVQKRFSRDELLEEIRSLFAVGSIPFPGRRDWWGNGQDLIDRLQATAVGREDALKYQRLIRDIFVFLFDSLSDFREELVELGPKTRVDVCANNGATNSFWSKMLLRRQADQIVIECKNVRKLENDHVSQLSGYLGRNIGHLGFLVTRNPPSQTRFEYARRFLLESDKVLLVLCDKDIMRMLEMKRSGQEPEAVLSQKYGDLVHGVYQRNQVMREEASDV